MTRIPAHSRNSLARVVSASLIGTTIEWYDFFLYGSAAALVFNKLFFPSSDPLTGTLLAFTTYAVGFFARPLGGLVFGHFGDKVGRKKLLVLSLLMMGGATCAIGLVPSYATIGVAAPLLLTTLRLVQGFALGGEWGGAVLIVSEHGDSRRRGFWASWPQAGAPGGNLLATGVLAVLAGLQSDEAFLSWGWRIPFLLSGVLVILGLWIRLSVSESPVFEAAAAARAEREQGTSSAPVLEVLRRNWREVLIAMGGRIGENASYYILTAFILVYLTGPVGLPKSVGLNAVLIASAVHFVTIPLWGALSDRIGRRPVTIFGALGVAAWSFVYFTLLDSGSSGIITVATTVGLLFHGAMYGPQAAYFSELFGTGVRYSGASIGYQLASVLAGGFSPLIATILLQRFGSSLPIALYVAGCTVLTVLATVISWETRGSSLQEVSEQKLAERGAV